MNSDKMRVARGGSGTLHLPHARFWDKMNKAVAFEDHDSVAPCVLSKARGDSTCGYCVCECVRSAGRWYRGVASASGGMVSESCRAPAPVEMRPLLYRCVCLCG